MKKLIVGSLVSLLLTAQLYAQPENVSLLVLDLDRKPMSTVTVGQPFLVAVEYILTGSTIASPVITGLNALHTISSRVSHSPIGSKVQVRGEYTVRVDTPAEITLGPVKIGAFQFDVRKTVHSVEPKEGDSSAVRTEPFALFAVSDVQPVVGQPVECTATLFVPKHDSIEVAGVQIDQTSCSDMVKYSSEVEEYRGLRLLDGQEYQHMSWSWTIIPKKEGNFTFPSCSMDYSPLQRNVSFFASFWGARSLKRVFSNAVTMNVSALPEQDGPIHAIVYDPSVTLHLDTDTLHAGDAVEYAIIIHSKQPMAVQDSFTVEGLPDSIKRYVSKPKINQGVGDHTVSLGCVLQCFEQGTVIIPEQTVRLYDSQKKQIRTVTIPACELAVSPGEAGAMPSAPITPETAPEAQDMQAQLQEIEQARRQARDALILQQMVPLLADGSGHTTRIGLLLWCITFSLLLWLLIPRYYTDRLIRFLSWRYVYWRARLRLRLAWTLGKPELVWSILHQLFVAWNIIKIAEADPLIQTICYRLSLPEQQREPFMALWSDIARARLDGQLFSDGRLFAKVEAWLQEYVKEI